MRASSKYLDDSKLNQWLAEAKKSSLFFMDYLYKVNGLLYIEPASEAASKPIVDGVTRKLVAAFHLADMFPAAHGGSHTCSCKKARSANRDFVLPNGMLTNALCIHYLACHRESVPVEQLAMIDALTFGEIEPTAEEIYPTATAFDKIPC